MTPSFWLRVAIIIKQRMYFESITFSVTLSFVVPPSVGFRKRAGREGRGRKRFLYSRGLLASAWRHTPVFQRFYRKRGRGSREKVDGRERRKERFRSNEFRRLMRRSYIAIVFASPRNIEVCSRLRSAHLSNRRMQVFTNQARRPLAFF